MTSVKKESKIDNEKDKDYTVYYLEESCYYGKDCRGFRSGKCPYNHNGLRGTIKSNVKKLPYGFCKFESLDNSKNIRCKRKACSFDHLKGKIKYVNGTDKVKLVDTKSTSTEDVFIKIDDCDKNPNILNNINSEKVVQKKLTKKEKLVSNKNEVEKKKEENDKEKVKEKEIQEKNEDIKKVQEKNEDIKKVQEKNEDIKKVQEKKEDINKISKLRMITNTNTKYIKEKKNKDKYKKNNDKYNKNNGKFKNNIKIKNGFNFKKLNLDMRSLSSI